MLESVLEVYHIEWALWLGHGTVAGGASDVAKQCSYLLSTGYPLLFITSSNFPSGLSAGMCG
jgi:hypothetical protein